VAVGTETDGSIICPSGAHSLVGIKPTVGLVSRAGIIPISATQDTAGPIARNVTDAALLLAALAGADPRDPATRAQPTAADYVEALRRTDLRGLRIGVARKSYFDYHPATDALAEDAVRQLSRLGATIVDHANVRTAGEWGDAEYQVLLYEFKAGVEAYLATLGPGRPRRLADLIEGNRKDAAHEMPYFGQEVFERAEKKGSLSSPRYRRALATCRRLARTEGLDATLARHRLDALVAPSGGPPWLIDPVNGDHEAGSSYGAAAVAGYPGITVPTGYVCGLPVGISFFGAAWSEPTLIRIAHAYEQATTHRRAPDFRPSAALASGTRND
jgi:amidase